MDIKKILKDYGLTEEQYENVLKDASKKIDRISDLDWSDICENYNLDIHFDTLRKASSTPFGGAAVYEYFHEKGAFNEDSDEYIKKLQEQKNEIQRERYKLQAAKIELNRYDRQDSRFELFYENVRDAIVRLDPPKFNGQKYEVHPEKAWVLGMGDIHFGAKFKSENNIYSREECKLRLEKLIGKLINHIYDNEISKLKIVNVADTIQGILRMTDLKLNDIPVVESVVEISRLLAEFLNQLSSYCEIEYYHCSSSNHSQTRPLGSKASEIATEDLEKIIVSYIADLLAGNKRVEVISDISKEYLIFDIFNFKAIVMHGHQIKSVPNIIKDMSNIHRTFYDYAFLGHRHSANEIIVGEGEHHNLEILTCPSFIGSDPYADSLRVGGKAMAKLYEFDEKHGHVGSKNIILN